MVEELCLKEVTYRSIILRSVVSRMQDVGCDEEGRVWEKQRVNCKLCEQKAAWSYLPLRACNTPLNARESTSESPSEAVRPIHMASLYSISVACTLLPSNIDAKVHMLAAEISSTTPDHPNSQCEDAINSTDNYIHPCL